MHRCSVAARPAALVSASTLSAPHAPTRGTLGLSFTLLLVVTTLAPGCGALLGLEEGKPRGAEAGTASVSSAAGAGGTNSTHGGASTGGGLAGASNPLDAGQGGAPEAGAAGLGSAEDGGEAGTNGGTVNAGGTSNAGAGSGSGGKPQAGAGTGAGGANGGTGGATVSTGGASKGGMSSGGAPSGGAPSGGAPSGGAPSGGAPSGGAPSGGSAGTTGASLDVDVSVSQLWNRTAPNPYLSIWKDGSVLAANDSSAVIISNTQNPVASVFPSAGRPTIYVPPNSAFTELALMHYSQFEAYTETGTQKWSNAIHGCCGYLAIAVDPALAQLYTGHGVTVLDANTGQTLSAVSTQTQGIRGFLIGSASAYQFHQTGVRRVSRADSSEQWNYSFGTGLDFPGALTGANGVVAVSNTNTTVIHIGSNGVQVWQKTLKNPGFPVITSGGLAIVSSSDSAGARLNAFRLSNGDLAWSTPLDAPLLDVLVADDGLLYVALDGITTIQSFEQATGIARHRFRNVTFPREILLRAGRLYASGGGRVTAFAVPASGYDPNSPWPVRYHDNQRTSSATSSLSF